MEFELLSGREQLNEPSGDDPAFSHHAAVESMHSKAAETMNPPNHARFGLTTMTCVVIAGMIGSGVFTTSGFALADLGSPARVLFAWAVGGTIALCGAVAYGELARRMPQSGGEYLYLSRHMHPFAGFLAGWISLTVGFSGSIALVALTFEEYVVPADIRPSWLPERLSAILVIIVFGVGHAFWVRFFALLQNFIVGIKLSALCGFLIVAALSIPGHSWHWDSTGQTTQPLFAWSTLLAMSTSVMFISLSYAGFNSAIYVASEVSNSDRTIPRALIIGTVLVTVLYLLLNTVFLTATPGEAIRGQANVAAIAARAIGGTSLELLIRTAIGLGTLSSVAGMIMIGPRVIARMADDGLFFSAFRTGSDSVRRSVLLQAFLALALVFKSDIKALLGYLGATLSLSSAIAVSTLILPAFINSGRHADKMQRPAIGVQLAAFIYVASTAILIVMMMRHDWHDLERSALTLGSGVVVWFVMKLWTRQRIRGAK